MRRNDSIFSYYEPNEKLKPYISYYSIQHLNFEFSLPEFIPDLGGCLIINVCANSNFNIVWGPFNILTTSNNSDYQPLIRYFVEFQPGGLSRLIKNDVYSLKNKKITLLDVNSEIDHSINSFINTNTEPQSVIINLDLLFLSILDKPNEIFENGRLVLAILQDMNSMKKINEVVVEAFFSHRQLNRYMKMFTSVSLKEYVRIKRFNYAIELLKENDANIEEIALKLGYFDSSHFIKDFSKIAHITPTQFRVNKSKFYNESMKRF